MTKKEQRKQAIIKFFTAVEDTFGYHIITEDGENGRNNFQVEDMWFELNSSATDVNSFITRGEKLYNKAFELRCDLQTMLNRINEELERV